jgi:PadR family transcriptional regulator, regulatory protein AphA
MTTVSYAILGLLDLRPHTAYDLVQQMGRSGIFWQTADSVVYSEPKALVQRGYATVERDGRASRYEITDLGRRALQDWLGEPSDGPVVQFEAMLKVLFAPAGHIADLRLAVASIREWIAEMRTRARLISLSYVEGTAPYSDRAHIVRLTMAYQVNFIDAVERWCDFADAEIKSWRTTRRSANDVDLTVFQRVLAGAPVLSD